jgi:thiamine-monophosphate kinase
MKTKEVGEFGLIERLRGAASGLPSNVIVGIGDDCAVVRPDEERDLLFTCDCQIQGIHFRTEWISARALGRRVAAVNLSDVAAMGGEPLWALCSLAVPDDTGVEWIEALYEGLREGLASAGAALVGGNTAKLAGTALVDLFLCGAVERGRALRRGGAHPGDGVYITGPLGASAAGLAALCGGLGPVDPRLAEEAISRHLSPEPRLAAGRALAGTGVVSSCIDVSDGLVQDAGHIAESSGVALRIDADLVPIGPATRALAAASGADPLAWALRGGEELELLFTVAPGDEGAVVDAVARASSVPPVRIGEVVEGRAVTVHRGGAPLALDAEGWDHFRGA